MNVACIPVLIEQLVGGDLALSKCNGKTLLRHTFEAVCRARRFDQIIIATNSKLVSDLVDAWGCKCYVDDLFAGQKNRLVSEAVSHIADYAEAVVSLHVNEPDMPSGYLDRVVSSVESKGGVVALVGPFDNMTQTGMATNDELEIKTVVSKQGQALYFTRAETRGAGKLMGCFGFDRSSLRRIENMPQSSMAAREAIEPLQWLDNGLNVSVLQVEYSTLAIRSKEELKFWEPPTDASHVGI